MSPFAPNGPLPAAGRPAATPSPPITSLDHSSPGHTPQDWSSPGTNTQAMVNTIPPNSSPISSPFYDPAQSVPPDPSRRDPASLDQPPVGAGQYAMAAFVGLLFAVLIGGGGFFIWHTRTTHVATTMPVVTTAVTASPAGSGATPQSTASPEITFNVFPADATLTVDGRDIGQARSVARPAAGKSATLVAKAKGYEDTTISIDYFTNATTEITLKPVIEVDGPGGGVATSPSASPSASASAIDPAASAKPKPKPRPKDPNALPDNPY